MKHLNAMGWAIAVILFAVGQHVVPAQPEDPCKALLPPTLQKQMQREYPTWRLVTLTDLGDDDRQLWLNKHGGACPGVAKGNFDGSARPQFALLLKADESRTLLKLVNAVMDRAKSYRFTPLAEDIRFTYVIYGLPPGQYFAVEDRATPIKVRHDAIALERLEVGMSIFYYLDGKFKQSVVSQ